MSPVNLGLFLFLMLTGGGVRSSDDFSNRFTNFDWQLTKNVGAKAWNDNVVLSPVSLKLVLATLKEGSAGNTSRQLENALNLSEDPKANTVSIATFAAIVRSLQIPGDGYDLDVGTKVYVDDETEPYEMFKNKIQFLYDAAMEKVDFQKGEETVKKINKWVDSVTKGHIQHLISDSDSLKDTSMIILNAIYFKGKWEFPFAPKDTAPGEFYVSPSRTVQVSYMKAVNRLSYAEVPSIKASILRLPYSGDKFAMYLVLPEKKNGLEDVIRSITPERLRQAKESMEPLSVNVKLPKFNFEFTASLMQTLIELGLRDMFGARANFSRMAPGSKGDLYVSNVLQKAGLEVNEIGSIAFAATQIELSNKFGEETAEFHVDRPFLFFIEDEPTMTVVFAGKVVDPTLRGSPTVRVIQPRIEPQPRPQPAVHRPSGGEEEPPTTTTTTTERPLDDRYGRPTKRPPGSGRFSFFDIELLQWLYREEKSNLVVSPGSLKASLGLVLEGARGNTAAQLIHTLRLPANLTMAKDKLHDYIDLLTDGGDSSSGVTLKMGSRLLVKKGLETKPRFRESIADNFKAAINTVDFGNKQRIANEVNAWVNNITHGFIPALINADSLDVNSLVVVLNAFYFKGDWKYPFDPASTHSACFYVGENSCVKTDMMTVTANFKHIHLDVLKARVLELPYADERYSMVIVLPDSRTGMRQLVKDLPFVSLIPVLDDEIQEEVVVTIPKFSLEYDVQMVPILHRNGLTDIFTDKSDLTDMFLGDIKPYVSAIFHKAKIIVNEKGTTAGAGTALSAVPLMLQETTSFVADHEFIFFIRDVHTGFLFVGALIDPRSAQVSASVAPISQTVASDQNLISEGSSATSDMMAAPQMPDDVPRRTTQPPWRSTTPGQRRPSGGGGGAQISSRPYPPPRRNQTERNRQTSTGLYFST